MLLDYQKIYDHFIESRRAIEGDLSGYTERHHILPRALGGGDEKGNIVRLTPEDHFFAHLLLAKIHGGNMWSPVAFMVGGSRNHYRPIESRKKYGWAKIALAKSKMREGAYNFDSRIHRVRNKDGRKWRGVQADMSEIGLNNTSACNLVNGNIKITHGGWFLDNGQPVPRQGELHHRSKQDVYDFMSADGETFHGTRLEFERHTGMGRSMISRLVTGVHVTAKGWTIEGRTPPVTGRAAALWRDRERRSRS